MIELDSGLAAQQALAMTRATMSMMKSAADSQQQVADMLATTVSASNRGTNVDLHA